MVDSWGSGAIMGTTAPEIGDAVLQTVAVLTFDAGQREKVVLGCLYHRPTSGICHLHQRSPTFRNRKAVLRRRWVGSVRARTNHLRRMPRSCAQNATLSMRKRTTKHRIPQLHQLASPQKKKEKQFGSATCVHIGPVATRTRRCQVALRLQPRSRQGKFPSSGKDAGLLSKRVAEPSASLASRATRGAAWPVASQGKGAAARRPSSFFFALFWCPPELSRSAANAPAHGRA